MIALYSTTPLHNPAGAPAGALPHRRPGPQRQARPQRQRRPACLSASAAGEAQRSSGGSGGGTSTSGTRSQPSTPSSAPGASSSSGSSSVTRHRPATAPAFRVRPAEAGDYWATADLHCCAFYPRATFFWYSALRVDRVMSLQHGKERMEERIGCFACLVADARDYGSSSSSRSASSSSGGGSEGEGGAAPLSVARGSSYGLPPGLPAAIAASQAAAAARGQVDLGPLVDWCVGLFWPPSMRVNYARSYAGGGLLGATVIDTMGEFVPPKRTQMPNGAVREVPRKGICYLSNLAVAPCTRRSGVGRKLLQEAEQLAASWGCRSMALHVDPSNTAAVQMYTRAGYRKVSDQPECQRILEQRSTPLALYMRALPWEARQAARRDAEAAARPQEQQQQQQQGGAA